MRTKRVTQRYQPPKVDRYTIDVEVASRECPRCGQPLRRNGRCSSNDCETQFSQTSDDLIVAYERSLED